MENAVSQRGGPCTFLCASGAALVLKIAYAFNACTTQAARLLESSYLDRHDVVLITSEGSCAQKYYCMIPGQFMLHKTCHNKSVGIVVGLLLDLSQ